jgi:hypothetical protein
MLRTSSTYTERRVLLASHFVQIVKLVFPAAEAQTAVASSSNIHCKPFQMTKRAIGIGMHYLKRNPKLDNKK